MGRVAIGTFLVLLVAGMALAQRGRFGDQSEGRLAQPLLTADNIPYDGTFAFVRLAYDTLPGGYWYRGQPAWSHGYPTSEDNLMQILETFTSVTGHRRTNTLSLEDPEIFKYPLLYIIEVRWWQITDTEARNLRTFLDNHPPGLQSVLYDRITRHLPAGLQRRPPDLPRTV